jgi:hypothetical protein
MYCLYRKQLRQFVCTQTTRDEGRFELYGDFYEYKLFVNTNNVYVNLIRRVCATTHAQTHTVHTLL